MKVVVGVLAVAAALLAPPALTAPRDFAPGVQAQERRIPQRHPQRERAAQRERRAAPPERGERQRSRLTDQERRELRRDVDRANRELYRPRQGR